jgi:hypothetical protein
MFGQNSRLKKHYQIGVGVTNNGELYDRTEAQWEDLEAVGWQLLQENALTLTDYTKLNHDLAGSTGQPPWNFNRADHRAAMGELLGRLADRSFAECGLMISALCKYMNENDAGDGFYRKAVMLHLIPAAVYKNRSARWEWWATDHVGKVQAWVAGRKLLRTPAEG